jgi:bifunctional NMN adenylyltransferase/nudix hydrolase
MLKKYDVIVYIGRFQPAHNAHTQTIRLALELADRVVIIIGSSNEPRTYFKNPFVFDERAQMLQDCIHLNDRYRVDIVGIENQVYSDAQWAMRVTDAVQDRTQSSGLRIGKIGYKKDKTVEKVLNLFPTWEYTRCN